MSLAPEETAPVPVWLLKLEEQQVHRLKRKLGHEAGAGAPCQKCGDKCPGLDLHFWRKICKLCKCGKEDHDISDDDIYDFVQFQLLGSKSIKTKGVFLKDRKDEVILEWTPKGSSNDVKKYLDELPTDMIPVKGSEAAKIRKQRLQKQMPAHDIDASLCHALTPEEIKELEEYVAHIRKHSVGQGKIIRLSLLKGQQHKLNPSNAHLYSQYPPSQIASSQTVFLQSSDLANNLHNLSLRDKTNRAAFLNSQVPNDSILNQIDEVQPVSMGKTHDLNYSPLESTQNLQTNRAEFPNYIPKSIHLTGDTQNPTAIVNKITDVTYPNPNRESIHLPLTTTNVERHQEQYENPNFELNNANVDRVLSPTYVPNYINPTEHAVPSLSHTKDLNYPTSKYPINHANFGQLTTVHPTYNPTYINPIEHTQLPAPLGPMKDLIYATNANTEVPANLSIDKNLSKENLTIHNALNDLESYQQVPNTGLIKDITYPIYNNPDLSGISNDKENKYRGGKYPLLEQDAILNNQINTKYPLNEQDTHLKSQDFINRPQIPVLQAQSAINPFEIEQQLSSVGYIRDIDYPLVENLPDLPPPLPTSDPYDVVNSNTTMPACHECKKVFDDGAVAVSADRTANLWHAGCFNCHTCQQPLADLLYFYHKDTDNIYCGRDYAILKGIPRCAACDELIFVKEYCLAEDSTFHIKHFCCFECDEPLAGKSYVMENNQPVCVQCYENLKAEKCNDCGYVIRPDQKGVSLQNLHWHAEPECFACKFCRKSLFGSKMLLRNANLFCSDVCFKSFR